MRKSRGAAEGRRGVVTRNRVSEIMRNNKREKCVYAGKAILLISSCTRLSERIESSSIA
jgi:hypothetical protein